MLYMNQLLITVRECFCVTIDKYDFFNTTIYSLKRHQYQILVQMFFFKNMYVHFIITVSL